MAGRVDNLRRPSGKVPVQTTLKTTDAADESLQTATDPSPFRDTNNSTAMPRMGTTTKQPSPAGTRPMSVSATVKTPKAPGLVTSQGAVRNSRPAAKGLNQSLNVDRRQPRASGLNVTVSPVLKTHKMTAVPAQSNRNVRKGSANPAFYGDF
jgi:hypothetical protein